MDGLSVVGLTMPTQPWLWEVLYLGQEHDKLRVTLNNKAEFSPKGWQSFDIKDLSMAHFVKSGAHYMEWLSLRSLLTPTPGPGLL